MGTANSLLIISDNAEEISKFRSKLMLLRDVDAIIESNLDNAIETARKHIPDTVIVFVHDKNDKYLDMCKSIRVDTVLKNTPILFILDSFDEEYLLSGFDTGINDYITMPARDSNILMRVIWCLQKGESLRDNEKKNNLLSELGVINKDTGAYNSQYADKMLSNEVNSAHQYKTSLVLMMITIDKIYKSKVQDNFVAQIIKKSTRNSDIIGIPQPGTFYIILPKTEIKGVCTIFERIKNNTGGNFTVSAGACELEKEMSFAELTKMTNQALLNALEKGNSLIINDKYETKEKESKSWLDTAQEKNKNYKLFKQAFNKKLSNVIMPVFLESQKRLELKYQNKAKIEQLATESKCMFSIKDLTQNNEAVLKITDSGLSKIFIDVFYIQNGQQSNNRSKIDLPDLDEKSLINIIENISTQFDSF